VCAGTEGCTTSSASASATSATGAKSATGSYGSFASRLTLTAWVPTLPITRVWPSGADFATASAPMLPPAPVRFSTTTGWPQASVRRAPRMRE
jgi:hypothetical protein